MSVLRYSSNIRAVCLLICSSLLVLSSCLLVPRTDDTGVEGETDRETPEERKEEPAPPVSVEEVEKALMQLTLRMELPNELESLGSGTREIEETLALIFSLENGPLPEDGAVRRAVYRESGEIYHGFARSALERSEGSVLWRLRHVVEEHRHRLDVLVNDEGIPLHIGYRDPATGERIERQTRYGRALSQAEDGAHSGPSSREFSEESTSEAPEAAADAPAPDAANTQPAAEAPGYRQVELEELISRYLPPYYQGLELVGKVEIEEAGRTLEAIHLQRELGSGYGGAIHVWYSRAVPGRILRVRVGEDIRKVGIEEWDVSLE